jgi:hypothetical protein
VAEYTEPMPDACPACGKRYQPRQVLVSWTPCDCGDGRGHISAECLAETGGCGHTHLEGHVGPEPDEGTMPNFGQAPR